MYYTCLCDVINSYSLTIEQKGEKFGIHLKMIFFYFSMKILLYTWPRGNAARIFSDVIDIVVYYKAGAAWDIIYV